MIWAARGTMGPLAGGFRIIGLSALLAAGCGARTSDLADYATGGEPTQTETSEQSDTDDTCEGEGGDAVYERGECTPELEAMELAECLCGLYPACPCTQTYDECMEETPAFVDLLQFQSDDCVDAVVVAFECAAALDCEDRAEYDAYFETCEEDDPDGSERPFCREQAVAVSEACAGVSLQCSE